MAIMVEALLQPVSADDPAGPSLEYDSAYLALQKAAEGVPEQQVGTEIIPAVEPDWLAVRTGADELLKGSKDLRLAVLLDAGLLRTEGLPGLRDGLKVLRGLVELYWDVLHPKLDPDDNNDPTERINILRAYASREAGGGVEAPMIKALRETPLVSSRQIGRFGLKQIALATGEVPPAAGETKPEMNAIDAAARDVDVTVLQTARDAADESVTLAKELEALVDGHVGSGGGVDFKDFVRALQSAVKYLDRFLALHGVGSGSVEEGAGASEDGNTGSFQGGGGGGAPMTGDIRSNGDVIRLLEKICDFYERTEPSSPIPLLVRRAQRLVGKDFWQVLQELSPETINAVKVISGADPKAPEGS